MWVFDDARVGLVQEPFVSGADTWIDRVVADIPDAENGFTLIFSSSPFPVTSIDSIGGGQKVVGIGITRLTWTWRDGCVQLFSDTSPTPQFLYTPK
jgi:hypothetical protein